MNTMIYKGYAAKIEYSDEDQCFIGHIAGINDVVGFHGESVVELQTAFHEAVEDYVQTCEKAGRHPQKPCSGRILLRISPEIHAKVAILAEVQGKSINAWISDVLQQTG